MKYNRASVLLNLALISWMLQVSSVLYAANIGLGEENAQNSLAYKMYLRDSGSHDFSKKYAVVCIIKSAKFNIFNVNFKVYSSYKYDHCNPYQFEKLTEASAFAQLGTAERFDYISTDGPHFQMMDRNLSPVNNRYVSIGTINYSLEAEGSAYLFKHIFNNLFYRNKNFEGTEYKPFDLQGDAYYLWYPDSYAYVLVDNKGHNFVMTHMTANIKIDGLVNIEDAAKNMGQYMRIPDGWRYEAVLLNKLLIVRTFDLKTRARARLIDQFGNLYIKLDQPLI